MMPYLGGIEDDEQLKRRLVSVSELIRRFIPNTASRISTLQREYNEVITHAPSMSYFRRHPAKNRYGNVFLYDHSRVVLRDFPGGDYIHASYVDSLEQKRRLIITQAPLPNTRADYWHMLVQEQAQVIVALCTFDPSNQLSADPFPEYWPKVKNETMTFGDVRVTCVTSEAHGLMAITELRVCAKTRDPVRSLTHLHFRGEAWKPGGAPKSELQTLIDLTFEKECAMSIKNRHGISSPPPLVIHCGSGTARSGQFAALIIGCDTMRNHRPLSIKSIVGQVQSNRYGTLRDTSQLVALIVALIDYGKRHRIIESFPSRFPQIINILNAKLGGGIA